MNGSIAVKGMALAKARVLIDQDTELEICHIENIDMELARLREAAKQCAGELAQIIEQLQSDADAESAEILDFQILLLEDENYMGQITRVITEERVNCESAITECSEKYRLELAALDNPYLNERVADITDIEKRLLRALKHKEKDPWGEEPKIVVAVDLTPSQVAEFGREKLKGIILEKGGMSSHCVILSRSMGIPCMVGVSGVLDYVTDQQPVLLDAIQGEVIVDPSETQCAGYQRYRAEQEALRVDLERFRRAETWTSDGKQMRVYGNISTVKEVEGLLEQGGEGVGLYRTEMMYMEQVTPPDEDDQYHIYVEAVKNLAGRPLIIRTLDVGGDKRIPYLHIPEEENPFLGYRAIRYCLDHPEIFDVQLSAILRAAVYGPVQLLLPMIATVTEVRNAKLAVERVRKTLAERNVQYGTVTVGIMVETPAAAILADQFAEEVDFFSIGTNDLTQYLYAADRNNANVAALNSYFQPALLTMVAHICECAHKHGIEVDICGQAGEVSELIPLWVGMGVDNLSVSIPSIPMVRKLIAGCDTQKCRALVNQVLQFHSDEMVRNKMREEVGKWS